MKKFLLICLSVINYAFAQNTGISFETKFYDAIDKWVLFDKKENQNSYALGFIYLDLYAGFTFNYEGEVLIKGNKLQKLPRLDSTTNIKSRLDQNTFDVYMLNEKQIEDLALPKVPEWLSSYNQNSDFIENRIKTASFLNGAGASHKALPILLKAYEEDNHYAGLEFELGYAYNATGSFYKAVMILNKAIENDPSNFWFYRELGFAFKHLNNLPEAEKAYRQAIELTSENTYKAEVAINMAQSYFHNKNRSKFDEWKQIVIENATAESMYMAYIQYFEENWSKAR